MKNLLEPDNWLMIDGVRFHCIIMLCDRWRASIFLSHHPSPTFFEGNLLRPKSFNTIMTEEEEAVREERRAVAQLEGGRPDVTPGRSG